MILAGLSISGQMKVSTLQNGFLKIFGLRLRVYVGRSFADPDQTLAQVRKNKGRGKALSVAKNMKVGNLEDKFEEEFGLTVQVAGSDDSYLCDNALTLNGAQREDEKKLGRKKRKAEQDQNKSDIDEKSKVEMNSNENFDLDDDEENVEFIELSFKNSGGEFQYHRLNKEEAEYIKAEYTSDKENFLNMNLNGGDCFDNTIWHGSYGPSIDGLELKNEVDGSKIDINRVSLKQEFYTNGEDKEQLNCLDFSYVTEGKVFGNIMVPVPEDEEFDPAKLLLKYVEYNLEGYPERYGKILHEAEYDGELCELTVEDSGQDVFRSLLGFDVEYGDQVIIHDTKHHPEWNWDELEYLFK